MKPRSNCYLVNLWRMKQKSCFFGESPKMMTDFRACCELIISIHKEAEVCAKKTSIDWTAQCLQKISLQADVIGIPFL